MHCIKLSFPGIVQDIGMEKKTNHTTVVLYTQCMVHKMQSRFPTPRFVPKRAGIILHWQYKARVANSFSQNLIMDSIYSKGKALFQV